MSTSSGGRWPAAARALRAAIYHPGPYDAPPPPPPARSAEKRSLILCFTAEREAPDRGGSNQHPALLQRQDCTPMAWYRSIAREGRMRVTFGRRELLVALSGAAVAWPLAARAQQGERVPRIGVLMNLSAD